MLFTSLVLNISANSRVHCHSKACVMVQRPSHQLFTSHRETGRSDIFPSIAERLAPLTDLGCVSQYSTLSAVQFEKISEETLESLCERFEQLNELESCPPDFDVTYSAGVLTVQLGGGKYSLTQRSTHLD